MSLVIRSLPVFAMILVLALLANSTQDGGLLDGEYRVTALVFAAVAAIGIRFYWDKRREQRLAVIERARKRHKHQ